MPKITINYSSHSKKPKFGLDSQTAFVKLKEFIHFSIILLGRMP